MRIRIKTLKRLIREALDIDEVAVAIIGDKSNAHVIAYKISVLEELLLNPSQSIKLNCVVAGVWGSKKARLGSCNDAAVVKKSVSGVKGWGTKIYLAAINYFESMASDRESVSTSARGLWKSLVSKGLVTGEEFDDIELPWTEPEEDDCKLHQRDPILNRSYRLTSSLPSDVIDALQKGQQHMADLSNRGLSDKAAKILKDGFSSLFFAKY